MLGTFSALMIRVYAFTVSKSGSTLYSRHLSSWVHALMVWMVYSRPTASIHARHTDIYVRHPPPPCPGIVPLWNGSLPLCTAKRHNIPPHGGILYHLMSVSEPLTVSQSSLAHILKLCAYMGIHGTLTWIGILTSTLGNTWIMHVPTSGKRSATRRTLGHVLVLTTSLCH